MATFRPNRAGEQQLFHSEMVAYGVRHHADNLLEIANGEVPEKSGDLKRSGKVVRRVYGFSVQYTMPYAAAVHDGSKRHIIEAKAGKMLKFIGKDGQTVYRKRVNHPGNKKNPWLWRAAMIKRARGL